MTIKEIATKLADYCRQGQWEAAQRELYAADAISVESTEMPMFAKETKGLEAIIKKGHTFNTMVEKFNSVTLSEPLICENSFVLKMTLDAVIKGRGHVNNAELCVYEVKNGKIVAERFFP